MRIAWKRTSPHKHDDDDDDATVSIYHGARGRAQLFCEGPGWFTFRFELLRCGSRSPTIFPPPPAAFAGASRSFYNEIKSIHALPHPRALLATRRNAVISFMPSSEQRGHLLRDTNSLYFFRIIILSNYFQYIFVENFFHLKPCASIKKYIW